MFFNKTSHSKFDKLMEKLPWMALLFIRMKQMLQGNFAAQFVNNHVVP